MNVTIIKGSIGKEHVHLLVSCPPSISVSKIVQQLKGKTSRVLLSEYKELRKRYYGQHLWGVGLYFQYNGTKPCTLVHGRRQPLTKFALNSTHKNPKIR